MDKISQELLNVGTELVASGTRRLTSELQKRTGYSLKTIYERLRRWQRELGQTETDKPNAHRLITDFAIYKTWQRFLEMLEDQEKEFPDNPTKLLKAFIGQVVSFLHKEHALIRVVTSGVPSWTLKRPRTFPSQQRECWGRLQRTLHRAQKEGSLIQSVDPDLLLRIIHGALHQVLYGLTLREVVEESYTAEDATAAMELLLDRLG